MSKSRWLHVSKSVEKLKGLRPSRFRLSELQKLRWDSNYFNSSFLVYIERYQNNDSIKDSLEKIASVFLGCHAFPSWKLEAKYKKRTAAVYSCRVILN